MLTRHVCLWVVCQFLMDKCDCLEILLVLISTVGEIIFNLSGVLWHLWQFHSNGKSIRSWYIIAFAKKSLFIILEWLEKKLSTYVLVFIMLEWFHPQTQGTLSLYPDISQSESSKYAPFLNNDNKLSLLIVYETIKKTPNIIIIYLVVRCNSPIAVGNGSRG